MERLVKGDVIVIGFPYSDLTYYKIKGQGHARIDKIMKL